VRQQVAIAASLFAFLFLRQRFRYMELTWAFSRLLPGMQGLGFGDGR